MKNTYQTKDLYEAAFLYSCRIKLLGLEGENNYYWFVFENKSLADEMAYKYWQREGLVEAYAYAEAIRLLKNRIYAGR
jgi:hypothetical protein